MMKKNSLKNDDAVSPVVGVMLMLVVTIVIAAVVAAFAGGLTTSQEVKPIVTLETSYSQSNGLIVTNIGSSTTPTDFTLWIRPGEETGMSDMLYELPLDDSKISDVFSSGTSIYFSAKEVQDILTDEFGQYKYPWMITCDLDGQRNAVGKTYYVELVDESGTFAKSKGIIIA